MNNHQLKKGQPQWHRQRDIQITQITNHNIVQRYIGYTNEGRDKQ